MRIVCVHPAGEPVSCGNGKGPVRIGSAPDNDVVPVGPGVDPHHATIHADARGLALRVYPGCRRVYVNARVVKEKALLRYGDTLTLGANRFLLTADSAPPRASAVALENTCPQGPVTLRVVSGAASGQALVVAPELQLGTGSAHFADLAYRCRVVQAASSLLFESDGGPARVNGWRCDDARLTAGDQIVLNEHHLIVEAPSLQYARHVAGLPPPPATLDPAPEPPSASHTEVWWLIAAAVVLAAIIAVLLYFGW